MIRIGYLPWLVRVSRDQLGGGRARHAAALVPPARTIRVLQAIPSGANFRLVAREVRPSRIEDSCVLDADEAAFPQGEPGALGRLARWMALDAVWQSESLHISTGSPFRPVIVGRARRTILRRLLEGKSDAEEPVEFLDLSEDQARRWGGRRPIPWGRQEDMAWHRSMLLLRSSLSRPGLLEVGETGCLTIGTPLGRFVVPVTRMGMVQRFLGDCLEGHYCLVTADPGIPWGDEVMARILLLRTDAERFLRTARRHEP